VDHVLSITRERVPAGDMTQARFMVQAGLVLEAVGRSDDAWPLYEEAEMVLQGSSSSQYLPPDWRDRQIRAANEKAQCEEGG